MEGVHEGHVEGGDKRVALVIAVLALFLAIVETGGKSAQTHAITLNVESANLWSFFQARTVRQTTNNAAIAGADIQKLTTSDATVQAKIEAQQKVWRDQVAGWESNGTDGRKELTVNARHAEEQRDHYMAQYHFLEYAAALLQVAIVIASATIITSIPSLLFVSLALAAGGLVLSGIGLVAPDAFHF